MPGHSGADGPNGHGVQFDPFSMSDPAAFLRGMTAVTMFWSAPWRAAMIVADQAMRETSGDK